MRKDRQNTKSAYEILHDRLARLEQEVDALKYRRRWYSYIPAPLIRLVIMGASAGVVGAALALLSRGRG